MKPNLLSTRLLCFPSPVLFCYTRIFYLEIGGSNCKCFRFRFFRIKYNLNVSLSSLTALYYVHNPHGDGTVWGVHTVELEESSDPSTNMQAGPDGSNLQAEPGQMKWRTHSSVRKPFSKTKTGNDRQRHLVSASSLYRDAHRYTCTLTHMYTKTDRHTHTYRQTHTHRHTPEQKLVLSQWSTKT